MFDRAAFVEDLALRIAGHLRDRAAEFAAHRLGAVAVSTAPWHRSSGLAVLIETDALRKWHIGDWEHNEFAELDGPAVMLDAYTALQESNGRGSQYAPFFRACAEALCHKAVQEALAGYTLEPDFELFVEDPDDPNEVNYCEAVVGVSQARRKPKAEIVNNLAEAVKSPEAVRVLKLWYRDRPTAADEARIARLVNLEELYLTSLGLEELPRCVSKLSRLTALHLDSNRLAALTGLSKLPQLRLISLRGNGQLTADMIRELSATASLRQLWVGDCGLTEVPPEFQQLQALEEIYLFKNPLAELPDWLPAMTNLKRLGLVDAASETLKARLRKRHPHLEIW